MLVVPKRRIVESQPSTPQIRPASSPEARENQMISLAIDLAEQQLRDGTASSQVITHYLKLGSTKEREVIVKCGYEAGCLGYSLKKSLDDYNVDCVIMAPSTMLNINNKRVKTDKRDAENIAKNLALGTYKEVQVITGRDEEIKEYIRMLDDHKSALKKIKQQINAFVLRHGKSYSGKTKWTQAHIDWLKKLELEPNFKIILDEYLLTHNQLQEKIDKFSQEIENFSQEKEYKEKANKLKCLIGIKTITAMSILSEIGDINRFETAKHFSSFIGLTPGESSSGEKTQRLTITKAGNSHLRRLLVESAHCYNRGSITVKSKTLKKRQEGNSQEIIIYADKANERLKRRFYKFIKQEKKYNVIATAVARELSCFIWGMLNNKVV